MSLGQIILSLCVIGALALVAILWLFQTRGIYKLSAEDLPPEAIEAASIREVAFNAEDGTALSAWVVEPEGDAPVILSFYGNFSNQGRSFERYLPLMEQGYGFVMPRYRGAPGTDGTPSETHFIADARALYDQLDAIMGAEISAGRRVLHGFSLGTGVAGALAAEREGALLVIEAGYTRLCEFFEKRFKGAPVCALMWREKFDTLARIPNISMPVLIAHGAKDQSLPVAMAEALFDAAPDPKEIKIYENGSHIDLADHGFLEDFGAALQDLR